MFPQILKPVVNSIVPFIILFLPCFAIGDIKTTIPLSFNTGNPSPYGLPSTKISIQGKTLPVIFDTGYSKGSIALTAKGLKGLKVKYTGSETCSMTMTEKVCSKDFIIPKVTIGGLH